MKKICASKQWVIYYNPEEWAFIYIRKAPEQKNFAPETWTKQITVNLKERRIQIYTREKAGGPVTQRTINIL